ncbi:MAG TPA: TolC family protein [Candidatus Acidoferrales bacterium]|nr:TolC family protein [Candidatus Acidoferrales bacterium]
MKIACVIAMSGLMFGVTAAAQQPGASSRQKSEQSVNAQTAAGGSVLTLTEVVKLALAHSPDLALARVQYTVAKNYAGLDRSAFLPNLYTGSGAAYTNGFPETPGGQPPAVFEMQYSQAIFDKQQRGFQHSDEDLAKNKEIEYQNTRENVIVKAASSYLELGDVQRSLQLLQGERDSAQQIVDLTQQREAAGLELPVSVTQAQLQLAEIEQRIVRYQGREQVLTEQLRNMTGLPEGQSLHVSADESLAAPPLEPASNLVADVVGHSSGLREAENYRLARQELLKGAKGSYWPTVSLIGEYSVLSKINNYQEFFQPNSFQRNNVTVGISVNIPIFAAKTSAQVAYAKSNLDEANLELAAAKTAVKQGAEQQLQGLKEADAAKEVARLDLQLAQEQLQDAEAKFNQGHLTLSQLEQVRVLENEKWLAFLDAGLSRERADLSLLQATGQLAKLFP